MKSIKQIRELQVQLAENVESSGDVRKLTALVRAGLFDSNKLTMLKRALNKENVKMTRVEREALLELLDRLLTVVLANQGTFMKVKQSIQEEIEEPTEEELNEASKVDLDINQIPPIIIMKRRAIRVFPDGQKVALYWADRINKYISVPFQSIGISEETLNEAPSANSAIQGGATSRYLNRQTRRNAAELLRQTRTPVRAGIKAGAESPGTTAQKAGYGAGYALGSMIKGRIVKSKIKSRVLARKNAATNPYNPPNIIGAAKAANVPGIGKGAALVQKQMRLPEEKFKQRLQQIREQQEVNEWAPLVAAAARLAPAVIRGVGALARSGAGRAVGGALVGAGKGIARGTGKVLGKVKGWGSKVLKKFKGKGGAFGAGAAAGNALGGRDGDGSGADGSRKVDYTVQRPDSPAFKGTGVRSSSSYQTTRQRQADVNFARQQQENYKMIKSIAEGTESKELKFADGAVELSPSVAGKIVETYNALNATNKKIVLEMINKDKNSFMKFANFASSK